MNKIIGKVIVRETGAGVPDLLIVVCDLDPRTLPKDGLQDHTADPGPGLWQQISGTRLGSVATGGDGKFEFEYEYSAYQVRDQEKRPDLTLFVVAPEDAGAASCPRILHVSCGMRRNAGRIETYVIKLPLDQLRKAGILIPGTPPVPPETPGMDDLLSKLKAVADERRNASGDDRPFSQRYKEQRDRAAEETKRAGQPEPMPPRSFNLAIPMKFKSGSGVFAEASLSYDEETRRIMLKTGPEAQAVPLTFKGVQYSAGTGDGSGGKGSISLLIDDAGKEIRLQLPRSPQKLTAPDPGPSELYRWYKKELAAAAAGPHGAEPETE